MFPGARGLFTAGFLRVSFVLRWHLFIPRWRRREALGSLWGQVPACRALKLRGADGAVCYWVLLLPGHQWPGVCWTELVRRDHRESSLERGKAKGSGV